MTTPTPKKATEQTAIPKNDPTTLGTLPIGKLLVQYSVPAIIACTAVSLYNIVDSIFIGHGVGPMALSALAICLPLMNLLIAFCMMVAVGGATIASIFIGQKNISSATDVVNNVTVLCLIHAVAFGGITLVLLDPILYTFGATEATIGYARSFMRIYLYCTPISYVYIGLNNLMRATGYPRKAMVSALLSVVVNVALAPIFIFKMRMGIAGAAWATVSGQAAGFVWVLFHFLRRKSFCHLEWSNHWWVGRIIKKIYVIGTSPFLMNVMACVVVVFLNRALLDVGGDEKNLAVGAYGILNRTTMFFVMVIFGVTQGMQPILGYNYGAQMWGRVRKTLIKGVWIGTGIAAIGWVATECFPDAISHMFTDDPKLIELARHGFRVYFIWYPVVGAQIIIQNFFQSIGKPQISIALSLTRQLIFLLPFLLTLPHYWGITGVWASMCGSDMLAFITALITMLIFLHLQKKKHQNAATETKPAS